MTMINKSYGAHAKPLLAVVFSTLVLLGCRGEDSTDSGAFPATANPNQFAQFLNTAPAVPKAGVVEGDIDNLNDFPEAYYNSIDPDNTRDTFTKWRIENGFLNPDGSEADCNPANCRSTHVKFRDTKDLGYGRNMFLRWDTITGDVAVYVENFQVDVIPGLPYGPLNFEALVENDRTWNFGVNAIEYSAYPQTDPGAAKFTKFYNFAGEGKRAMLASGLQQHIVDLDGKGLKPMPTPCIVCHGGRGRTLVVERADGTKVLAPTIPGGIPGDVQANMQTIELDTLQFATTEGFTQADSEDGIRLINEAILSTFRDSLDNRQAGEWDPSFAIELLEGRYNNTPGVANTPYNSEFIPSGWQTTPNARNIYNNLVGPNCMVCHALRGVPLNNSSITFANFSQFLDFSDRIDHLTFERGLMPLGALNYSDFWDREDKNPALLAAAIGHSERIDASDRAIPPGAPVARIAAPPVASGVDSVSGAVLDIPISGGSSAFAGSYQWSVQPSATASIVATDAANGEAVLRASQAGQYTVELTINGVNGGTDNTSFTVDVRESTTDLPAPDQIVFYDAGGNGISDFLGSNCTACHSPGGTAGVPVHYVPCSADNAPAGEADSGGYEFLYRSVIARVNFDSPLDSLLLRKPLNGADNFADINGTAINNYHGGGIALNNQQDIGRLMAWILNGSPRGTIPAAPLDSAASCY